MTVARHEHIRWLCTTRPYPVCQHADQACRVLRFEIDRDHEVELLEWLHKNHMLRQMPWELQGPYQFMGVDVYLVPNLPAPGWRIINPMRKP